MKDKKPKNPRLGTVGGQAVMEGVMMKSKDETAVAVRRVEDGVIVVRSSEYKAMKDKCRFFRLPIIRGVVNFVDMMKLSFSTLTASAEMLGLEGEGEPESKFDKWLDKHMGKAAVQIASGIGVVLGVGLAMLLFIYLPMLCVTLIENLAHVSLGWWKNLIEGVIKIAIFIAYLGLIGLIPDIKRVFQYHGAEHKSIFCYEKGLELTVENVKKQIRFHPRCGTSFMFVILALSILVGSLIPWGNMWLRMALKLLLLPVIVGIGYEYIMYAGKHENTLTKILSAPGLWMQRLTTREPDDSQAEVGIYALKSALKKEFPDFEVPYESEYLEKLKAQKEAEKNNSESDSENKSKESQEITE